MKFVAVNSSNAAVYAGGQYVNENKHACSIEKKKKATTSH